MQIKQESQNLIKQASRLFTFICVTALVVLQGCKDPNLGGKDVLPSSDLINVLYTDTCRVQTNSILMDTVETYYEDYHLFGNYIDEFMGRIDAATYAQFRFPGTQFSFGDLDSLRADSVILSIDIVGYFGRIESQQYLKVNELTQKMDDTLTFSSVDTVKANHSKDLANRYLLNNGSSSLKDIRVKLDMELAEKLLATPDSNRASNEAFIRYFKGLKISTYPLSVFNVREPGAVLYASLQSSNTKLTLHYSKMDASGNYSKKQKYDYYVTSLSRQFHNIKRNDYAQRALGQELQTNPRPHQREFIQSGAFIQNFIKFPTLKNLGKIGINEATLYLKADPTTLGAQLGSGYRFNPPAIEVYLADTTLRKPGSNFVYASVGFNEELKAYVIPLNGYAQRLVNGQVSDLGVVVRPTEDLNYLSNTLNRVILGGMNHPTLKPELRLTYTTLPK